MSRTRGPTYMEGWKIDMRFYIVLAMLAPALGFGQGVITTIAGNGSLGNSGNGGAATSATFGSITGVAVDKAGNIYIADSIFNVVRKVNTQGVISAFAGGGNPASLGDGGPATSANLTLLGVHTGLAVDSAGNVYIADYGDSRIRKVDVSTGIISTVAGNSTTFGLGGFSGDGGPATSAGLNSPNGVAFDSAGNMYISDFGNSRIRKVDTSGTITTFAGIGNSGASDSGDGGPATSAQLSSINDVAVDGSGNVYIADLEHIRVVNSSGIINTAVQGSFGTCAQSPTPVASANVAANGLAVDSAGNLYIADKTADCVQELEPGGLVSTVAGGGFSSAIPATSAQLISPAAVAVDSSGNFYIGGYTSVRKVSALTTQPSAEPIISSEGVVNGASFTIGMAPNTWVTIQGTNFTTGTDYWSVTGGTLPTTLNGVSVTFSGLPGYVSYISPTQINVLTPANLTDQFPSVVVTNTVGSSSPATAFSPASMPAFFTWPNNQVVATHADFTWAVANGTFPGTTTVPAKPGETIILWGTGFGATSPATPEGVIVPSDQTYSTTAVPTVEVNLVTATVYGAALAPGYAGLYQLSFQVPSSLPDGTYQLFATVGSPAANVPMLTVQQ
jgi:uncharacterized protein (TIGR03437 family)